MSEAFRDVFPIGLGAGRFSFKNPNTYDADFEAAVDLVLYALERGVNYIDVGRSYSCGNSIPVLKEAFRRTDKPFHTTLKIYTFDSCVKVEKDDYQEALSVMEAMGLEKVSHFLCWSLMSREEFHRALTPGKPYDVALRLKKEGRIEHIGASLHMKPDEMLEAIDSGLFEFVMIACNLINFLEMRKVLDRAAEKNVDVLIMNPLFGGLIPENPHLFQKFCQPGDETVVQASVRTLLAHPAVKCVLAGASSREELDGYLSALGPAFDAEDKAERFRTVEQFISENLNFCSYCRYCDGCPQGIPVPELMNARNVIQQGEAASKSADQAYFRSLHNVTLENDADSKSMDQAYFRNLHDKFTVTFPTGENPCIQCGQCEQRCTQHLPIIQSIDEVYSRVRRRSYDMASRRERFEGLLNAPGYKKVGFWPASSGTIKILDMYKELFGSVPFEVFLFDSNKRYWGQERFGYTVHAGTEAVDLGVECILITSYVYGKDIQAQLRDLEKQGIDIKLLYGENDVDWWW